MSLLIRVPISLQGLYPPASCNTNRFPKASSPNIIALGGGVLGLQHLKTERHKKSFHCILDILITVYEFENNSLSEEVAA